jgi:hypothetical protein
VLRVWAGDEDANEQEGEGSKTPSKGGPSEHNQDKVRMHLRGCTSPCLMLLTRAKNVEAHADLLAHAHTQV